MIRGVFPGHDLRKIHICTVSKFFGLVPMELDETYPLAQHEVPRTIDLESRELISHTIKTYVKNHEYRAMIVHIDHRVIGEGSVKRIVNLCNKLGVHISVSPVERVNPRSKQALEEFQKALIEVHKITFRPPKLPADAVTKGGDS
jgi:predicted RNA-binding protein